jgi:hypothetical protein
MAFSVAVVIAKAGKGNTSVAPVIRKGIFIITTILINPINPTISSDVNKGKRAPNTKEKHPITLALQDITGLHRRDCRVVS